VTTFEKKEGKEKNTFSQNITKNITFSPIMSMEDEYKYGHCISFGTNIMSLTVAI